LRSLVVGLAFAITGCVLLARDPDDFSTTCHFEGEGSACGQCLVKSCQPEINQCCGDWSGRLVIQYQLEPCAAKVTCSSLKRESRGDDVGEAFGYCATTSCAGPCGINR
jgi:hypothetical protein